MLIDVSAIIPTKNRVLPLTRMLISLAQQSVQPLEMIVVDASINDETKQLCQSQIINLDTNIIYHRATETGAATQRNQAMKYATQNYIWLLDDDIIFEPNCVERLWQALHSDSQLGGVNAMITNQKYLTPSRISRHLFRLLHGRQEPSYAGKCIGPALNLLPEDNPSLPKVVSVEWLNTTCVMYQRKALPEPLFTDFFTGYSLMEDVTLSLIVGKQWKLANARTARIFHDSQPGDHKNNLGMLAKMDLVNRHYVMTQVLERKTAQDYFKLIVLQLFSILASLSSGKGWLSLPNILFGKLSGVKEIMFKTSQTTVSES
ncbi:putative glycosyltransferase [Xenococcus sp. PCC 7305]|uniref:glycosyltransferase family 2 protein n=1 Tax=Xenococcus sp. PCC 7305 TaxID=102125 RepID=UPI0002AC9314|nr:glycosyltransferase family 2 protein [Xenococcus sp. PCC 7305]ELS02158.1 putative glycosyltransferase [Xenococcus sp. PCC 7305]